MKAVITINIYLLRYDFSGSRAEEVRYQKELSVGLLRYVIKAESGLDWDKLHISKTEKGKPYVNGLPLKFNISHTKGLVVAACGKGEIGVDTEKIEDFSMRVAERVCTKNECERILRSKSPEKEFFSLWTFKEAFVKLIGSGLSYPLKKATLDEDCSVLSVYPALKIFSFNDGKYAVTAIEDGGLDVNFIKLGLSSIMDS